MANQTASDDVTSLVRRLKQNTEELIRHFDEAFLRTCGIAQDAEAELYATRGPKKLIERLWTRRK